MPHSGKIFGTGLVVVLFVAIFGWLCGPAHAQTAETYTVRNVSVDVSAENVGVARDRALAEGQRRAFDMLMQRLTSSTDWGRLPHPSDTDLVNLVLDVGIDQEKRSAVRYLATISVRFKPDAVRRLLRGANIAYAEWRGRPVLVLPVLQSENGPLLSESPNPWRDAWRSGAAQGVVPLVAVPPEQLDGVVTGAQAAAGGADVLAAVGQRFNTQDVLLAVATPVKLDGGKVKLDVVMTGVGPVATPLAGPKSYDGDIGETLDMVMRRAVEDIAKTASDSFKNGNMLQFDKQANLAVTVPLAGFDDWLAVRDKLTRSTPVRSYEVTALSKTEAALVLHYVGDQPQLEAVFMQNGLVLSWASDHWILQPVASRPNAGPR